MQKDAPTRAIAANDEAAALAAARDLASTRVDELAASVASAHELRRALADAESRVRVVEDRLAKALVRSGRFERRAREAESFVRSVASSTDAMDAEGGRVRDALARRCEVIEEEAAVDAAGGGGGGGGGGCEDGRELHRGGEGIERGWWRGGGAEPAEARRDAGRRAEGASARAGHRDANVGDALKTRCIRRRRRRS